MSSMRIQEIAFGSEIAMTTTVNIPEDILARAMRRAGTDSPEAAVSKAVVEYANRANDEDEVRSLFGTSDTFMTLEELMAMRETDE